MLRPQTRLKTRVVSVPGSNRIVLVGDGDATLASTTAAAAAAAAGPPGPPRLEPLARATAAALRTAGRLTVRLSYDASLFSAPDHGAVLADARTSSSGVVSPVTALSVDGGRTSPGAVTRSADPPAAAAPRSLRPCAARGCG